MTSQDSKTVISAADLEAAVASGIVARETADNLLAFANHRSAASGQADEESFRLVSSFNDIFVVIGLALFIGALIFLLRDMSATTSAAVIAGVAWLMSELFTRRKRLALPSIVLLGVFVLSVFVSVISAVGVPQPFSALNGIVGGGYDGVEFMTAGAAALVAATLHWLRFHVPITVAAGCAAIVVTAVAALEVFFPGILKEHPVFIFLPLGLAVFALAMRYDLSDLTRTTRRTDIAFWLHLLAAPLIVHPVVTGLSTSIGMSTAHAVTILVLFVILGIVALVVDRRALLVSSLSYLAYAAGTLIATTGWESSAFALAVLSVGAVVLLLSVAWRPLRSIVIRLMPLDLRNYVPVAA
jgi:hypothetical protein